MIPSMILKIACKMSARKRRELTISSLATSRIMRTHSFLRSAQGTFLSLYRLHRLSFSLKKGWRGLQ